MVRLCPGSQRSKVTVRLAFRYVTLIVVALCLYACSVARVGYDYAPELTWWWLDDYVGFDSEQAPVVKKAINDWFIWHRTAQLPEYVKALAQIRKQTSDSVTADQVCTWLENFQDVIKPALDQAAQQAAPIVLQLGEKQWQQLAQSYIESNDKHRRDYMQADLAERYEESLERTIDRIERFYGDINAEQRHFIANRLKQSPFDPEARLKERQRQQHNTLILLRQLVAQSVPEAQARNSLRAQLAHLFRSDDPAYRAYQIKLSQYTCGVIADLHNMTTPEQRLHIQEKLRVWEADFQTLIASG